MKQKITDYTIAAVVFMTIDAIVRLGIFPKAEALPQLELKINDRIEQKFNDLSRQIQDLKFSVVALNTKLSR